MRQFGRVVALALRYHWTLAASLACAIAVALLWCANIGVVYPFVEVAFEGRSFAQWAEDKIDEADRQQSRFAEEASQLQSQLARPDLDPDERQTLQRKLRLKRQNIQTEAQAADYYAWLLPYLRRYAPSDPYVTLTLLIGWLLAGTALKAVFLVGQGILAARMAQRATMELREEFYRRTIRMDVNTFSRDGVADLMSRFTHDMSHLAEGMYILFGKMIREPLKMVVCLVAAAIVSWQLLLLTLLLVPLAAVAIDWLAKMLRRANRRAMEQMARLYTRLEESFRSIRVIQAFTTESIEESRFNRENTRYYRHAMRIAGYDSLSHPMVENLGVLMICLALAAGAYLVMNGTTKLFGIPFCSRPLDLGSLFMFYGFLAGAADPARKLSSLLTCVQRAVAASDRVYAMVDREPSIRAPLAPQPLPPRPRDIVFDGVQFAYPGTEHHVLEDVHLTIEQGQTVAIVGPSGCGKSTLASLVHRFADPTRGQVRIGGIPVDQIDLTALRRAMGLVTQETLLFNDTVRENIRYGLPEATESQVIEAAQRAAAHRFITESLEAGYDTIVGPMGGQLSGGQRQRIALARAILRDPDILILDEATNQLDFQSKQSIHHALKDFVRDRTAIIITHLPGALLLADRCIVMENGRIVDDGPHDELLERSAYYRGLVTTMARTA